MTCLEFELRRGDRLDPWLDLPGRHHHTPWVFAALDAVTPRSLSGSLYLPSTTSYPILAINTSNPQSTEVNKLPLGEATSSVIQESTSTTRSAFTIDSETLSPPTDRISITPMSPATDGRAGISPAENALFNAKEVMTTINLSKTWEGALARIKWVMDTLSPVAEVRYKVLSANP